MSLLSSKSQKPDLIKKSEGSKAQVSLSDCLACSGCITTAETVLIQAQSVQELTAKISQNPEQKVFVAVSPQSCASLAFNLQIDDNEVPGLLSSALTRCFPGTPM